MRVPDVQYARSGEVATRAALVDQRDPSEGGQVLEEARRQRLFPYREKVAGKGGPGEWRLHARRAP